MTPLATCCPPRGRPPKSAGRSNSRIDPRRGARKRDRTEPNESHSSSGRGGRLSPHRHPRRNRRDRSVPVDGPPARARRVRGRREGGRGHGAARPSQTAAADRPPGIRPGGQPAGPGRLRHRFVTDTEPAGDRRDVDRSRPVDEALRRRPRRQPRLARDRGRRVLRAARAVGLRQEHDPADDRRPDGRRRGPDPAAGTGRQRAGSAGPARRVRLPALRAVPPHDRGRERRVRAEDQEGRGRRAQAPRRRAARAGRAVRARRAAASCGGS